MIRSLKRQQVPLISLSACLLILWTGAAWSAGEDVDAEFEYAASLIELGVPEYAEYLVGKLVERDPALKDRADVIRAQALISRRRFEQAEEVLAKMPTDSTKAQAVSLALADGYYAVGNEERSGVLYRGFFNLYTNEVPTDPDLLRFYQQAAHKFAQMLDRQGDPGSAAGVYDLLLQALGEGEMVRQIRLEQAEFLLKAARSAEGGDRNKMLKKVEDNCRAVVWGGMDLWFGRSITALAQVDVVRGRADQAEKLLRENLPILKKLDGVLEEQGIPPSESPFAGARSLLGTLYLQEAEALLAPQARREQEALAAFEREFAELQSIWNLITRTHKRDDALVKRQDKGKDALIGTPDARQEPFTDIAAALEKFEARLGDYAAKTAWAPGVLERAKKFAAKLRKLGTTVAEFPKDIGVTPAGEMKIEEDFASRKNVARGLTFLADEGARNHRAVEFYKKSLRQFYNVFAGYPGSDWGTEAGEKITFLKDKLQALTGQTVSIEARGGGRRKLALVMLNEGKNLYGRKEYAKAVEAYRKGLNEYPEGAESLVALANTMESYVHLQDPVRVKMIGHYLAERFTDRPAAAQALLRMGRLYFEAKDRLMYDYVYELYLNGFPEHSAAQTILYMLGEQRWKVEDYGGGVPYYKRLAKRYPKGPYYLKSLNRIGWSYYLSEDYEKAVEYFRQLVAQARHGEDKAQGQLCLADSYRLMEQDAQAINAYRELTKWLLEKGSVYMAGMHATKQYRTMLEQAVFFQAHCLSRIKEPADRVPAFREAATKLYRNFVKQFADSELAPTALSSLGAVLMAEGKTQEAAQAYEQLAEQYPKSDAGQFARYWMIKSLVDIGHSEKAKSELAKMVAEAEKYPVDHFLRVGQMMLDKGENDAAAQAFNQTLKMIEKVADDGQRANMEQRTLLGLGKAHHASGRFGEAVESLTSLSTKYPTSGLFYEARFLLAQSLKNGGKPGEAVEALREIFNRSSEQSLLNRATVELAGIQQASGGVDDALASYQRIVLLGDPDDAATRPLIETALVQSIRILVDKERWREVVENCDRYLSLFPSGENVGDVRKARTRATMRLSGEEATGE